MTTTDIKYFCGSQNNRKSRIVGMRHLGAKKGNKQALLLEVAIKEPEVIECANCGTQLGTEVTLRYLVCCEG